MKCARSKPGNPWMSAWKDKGYVHFYFSVLPQETPYMPQNQVKRDLPPYQLIYLWYFWSIFSNVRASSLYFGGKAQPPSQSAVSLFSYMDTPVSPRDWRRQCKMRMDLRFRLWAIGAKFTFYELLWHCHRSGETLSQRSCLARSNTPQMNVIIIDWSGFVTE
jgi:hypothetical protein